MQEPANDRQGDPRVQLLEFGIDSVSNLVPVNTVRLVFQLKL